MRKAHMAGFDGIRSSGEKLTAYEILISGSIADWQNALSQV
jgi:hypothetical protein